MSGLDVLAVMDAAILRNGHRGDNPGELRLQQEARAAVAELIKSAEVLVDAANPETSGWSELVDALARVTGGAA